MATQTPIARRGWVEVTFQTDIEGIELESERDNGLELPLFPPPTEKLDRSIFEGEILYASVDESSLLFNDMSYRFNHQQRPVRSCLNGKSIAYKTDNKQAHRLKLQNSLQVVGVAAKNVIYDAIPGESTKDQPVGIVNGLITMMNTSKTPVQAGDLILARVPDPDGGPQVDTRKGYNERTYISQNRRVLETVAWNRDSCKKYRVDFYDNQTDTVHFPDLVDFVARLDIAGAKAIFVDGKVSNAADVRAAANVKDVPDANFKTALSLLQVLYTSEDEALVSDDDDNFHESMFKAIRALCSVFMSRVVGVAQTDAPAGYKFDCLVTPAIRGYMDR